MRKAHPDFRAELMDLVGMIKEPSAVASPLLAVPRPPVCGVTVGKAPPATFRERPASAGDKLFPTYPISGESLAC